ncbi:uncharacterized protein LOC131480291 [Ochotona princeps]|uniref:uncharacterized protein LOC131480291 n=1 Tax=Ochotona princeps TaxID=9978 RepID=UPI0027151727|nr:uncharacterized protein LOC131480291 [Ochotona princeps]
MLSVLHFLRSFFKPAEPSVHLPGDSEAEDQRFLPPPAEAEDPTWSRETDQDDFETLSHHSDSRSDTRTDLFESASDAEDSLPGDLTCDAYLPPGGTPLTEAACQLGPDVPAHLTSVPWSDTQELDLSPGFKEQSCQHELPVFAAGAGGQDAGHGWDCVSGPEQVCLLAAGCCPRTAEGGSSSQGAREVSARHLRGLPRVPVPRFRSESCPGVHPLPPFLLPRCELGRSWPPIHKAGAPPCGGSLDSIAPLGSQASPRRRACRLQPRRHHSAPGNISEVGRVEPGQHCWHMRTLVRAHSTAGFPSEEPLRQNGGVFGTHLKDGAATEGTPRPSNCSSPKPTPLTPPLLAAASSQEEPSSVCSLQRTSQENQLQQDSRSRSVALRFPAELLKLHPQAATGPGDCKSEHSPASQPRQPHSPRGPANTQKQLQSLVVEVGSQTSDEVPKHALHGKEALPISAKFPRHWNSDETPTCNTGLMGGSQVSDSGAPGSPRTPAGKDSPEETQEAAMVLDPHCTKSILQDSAELRAPSCSPGNTQGDQRPASSNRCPLFIIAVEHKGLQATTRKAVGPPLGTQPAGLPAQRLLPPLSFSTSPCGSPTDRMGPTCELPAAPALQERDNEACHCPKNQHTDLGALVPESASGIEEVPEEKLPGESQSPGPEDTQRVDIGLQPSGSSRPPSPSRSPSLGLECDPEDAEGSSVQVLEEGTAAGAVKTGPGTPAWAIAHALQQPGVLSGRGKAVQEPGKHLVMPKVTSFQKGKPWATDGTGRSPSEPQVDENASPEPREGGGDVGTPGDLASRRPSSQRCHPKRQRTTERRLRARLASAHKTLTNFFESKVFEREHPQERPQGSLKGEEKRRSRQSSWRTFLRGKDSESPKGSSLAGQLPGPPPLEPPSPPLTVPGSHREGWTEDVVNCAFGEPWIPPHVPVPSMFPEPRRQSEPAIKCAAPEEGGGCGVPGQAGLNRTLPSSSACCLTSENQGMPRRPLSPKPRSPRPGSQRRDVRFPGRGSAVSMVSLGHYQDGDSVAGNCERVRSPTVRTCLLLSLQTLNQDTQQEECDNRGPCHPCLSATPSLKDLARGEDPDTWEESPGEKSSCSGMQRALHAEPAQRPLSGAQVAGGALHSLSVGAAPREALAPARSSPWRPHRSVDDLWLEKTQKKRLTEQVQVERKMRARVLRKDSVQDCRKMTVASPVSLKHSRRSCPLSQSAPAALNHLGRPQHTPVNVSAVKEMRWMAYELPSPLLYIQSLNVPLISQWLALCSAHSRPTVSPAKDTDDIPARSA